MTSEADGAAPAAPVTKPFKALRLDERDVFVELVTLDSEAQLTERHVDLRKRGGDCDRRPGEYRWDRKSGSLVPLPRQQRAVSGKPTLEQAFAFVLLKRAVGATDLGTTQAVELVWLDEMVKSVDFRVYLGVPLVQEYIAARGLVIEEKK
jgi:hypothetical protein